MFALQIALAAATIAPLTPPPAERPLTEVVTNDNRTPSGSLAGGTLTLKLRAAEGVWRPEGPTGPALQVQAFGEGTSSLMVPAPLIRVPEGTEIVASVRNDVDAPLRVHGLCERRGAPCAPLEVASGETGQVRFKAGEPGTYHYWATTTGMPLPFRAVGDTQLSGAFVVDAAGDASPADRIFVITDWTSLTRDQLRQVAAATDPGVAFLSLNPKVVFLMNGLSWPHTERLTYRLDESVRWKVINLSTQVHPMHLHGFYFVVDSLGDGLRDQVFPEGQRPRVVTQLMPPGATMTMMWKPERVGNWMFHCHVMRHVSPSTRLGEPVDAHGNHHAGHQTSAGMAGMILGVTVVGDDDSATNGDVKPAAARKLTLVMQAEPKRFGDRPAYGFVLADADRPASGGGVPVPGPTLALTRGEPVEITLINRLPEGTAIHWHGIELDSYYDGVHGWSGVGTRVTPMIEPGQSFVVRFTPPRAGTFMYHTHLHDHQLASGLYGAMVVMESGETFDPATDHVVVIGRAGPSDQAPAVLNGEREPKTVWAAGLKHRIRLINITPDDIFVTSLQTNDGPATWRPMTKDGAPLPPTRCQPGPAKQTIGVGEIYDFEYEAPAGRRTLWLEVRSPAGKWHAQGQIIVK
jgi:FtsP/CotA-like multicopper oxidase with cupredoxin domain